jgi:hypothetical protein
MSSPPPLALKSASVDSKLSDEFDLEKPGASTYTQDSVFDDPLLAK